MKHLLQEALIAAIATEKKSFHFYRSISAKVHDGTVRNLFERLADEVAQHLELFLRLSPSSEFSDLQSQLIKPPHFPNPLYRVCLVDMTGITSEKEALRLALQKEESCREHYSILVESFRAPAVRAVFQMVVDETLRHCEILREECRHNTRLAGWADQNFYIV